MLFSRIHVIDLCNLRIQHYFRMTFLKNRAVVKLSYSNYKETQINAILSKISRAILKMSISNLQDAAIVMSGEIRPNSITFRALYHRFSVPDKATHELKKNAEDQRSCKRSPDIWALFKHKRYKTG